MQKAIIFDFDGVIHDSFEYHRSKIEEFTGQKLTAQTYKDMHMGNFFNSQPEFLKDVDWYAYRDFIYQELINHSINNEIKEVILELSKKHQLFIVSSGANNIIKGFLENNNLLDKFQEILAAETHRSKETKFNYILKTYNLRKEQCLFITDTVGDIIEARRVDIRTIAVDFGFHERELLEKHKPYAIISRMQDLFLHLN